MTIDGQPSDDPDGLLPAGRVELAYHRPPWREPLPAPPLALTVLFSDADVLVVDKPAGLPVMPSELYWRHTVMTALGAAAGGPSPVHRLGVGTSGALVCARSACARRGLPAQFQAKSVEKRYRALLVGLPAEDFFTVTAPIGTVAYLGLGRLHAAAADGKPSVSHFEVLERRPAEGAGGASLVEVLIETGRPHQIRIHAAVAGHPLLGDPLYVAGGEPAPSLDGGEAQARPEEKAGRLALPRDCGYLLHSRRVCFDQPVTGARAVAEASCPPRLQTVAEVEVARSQTC